VTPPSLDTVLSRIGETQVPLPAPVVLLLGMAAFVVVLGQKLWLIARHVNTIVHEAAHAVVGLGRARGQRDDLGLTAPHELVRASIYPL